MLYHVCLYRDYIIGWPEVQCFAPRLADFSFAAFFGEITLVPEKKTMYNEV